MAIHSGIDTLSAACGGPLATRLWVSAADGSERDLGVLRRPYLIVGRSPQCDLQLDGSDISHRHAYFQFIGNRIFCADLGSRTGVHWPEGARAASWVRPTEHLAIGQYGLRFDVHDSDLADASSGLEQAAAASPQAKRPEVSLRFLNARLKADRSRQWSLHRTVTLLGHTPGCHITLRDASVSRVHASLVRTPLGVWVIDLLGKDGVEVNGERVACAALANGDVLRIGRFRMEVEQAPGGVIVDANHHSRTLTTGAAPVTSLSPAPLDHPWRPPVGAASPQNDRRIPDAADAAAHAAAPSTPPPGGLSEAFVLSLLNHSASMQQQMAAQQHQMLLLTMQMLSSMQGEQTKRVQAELQCIQTLTREIQQIRTKLTELTAPAPAAAPAPASPPVRHSQPDSSPAILPLRPPAAQHPSPSRPLRSGDAARQSTAAPAPQRPRIGLTPPAGAPVAGIPADLDGDALQTHLAARLAELERKRSGYWQKITRVMMG